MMQYKNGYNNILSRSKSVIVVSCLHIYYQLNSIHHILYNNTKYKQY